MRTLLLAILMAVSTATGATRAHAEGTPAQIQATDRAEQTELAAEKRVATLAARRAGLATQYEDELRAIDKLKKQRASWRRDREIQASMSTSVETAKQLAQVTKDLATANGELATAKRAWIAAAQAERPSAVGPRAAKLDKVIGASANGSPKQVHKIKVPSGEIDPLADPEELDEQAQTLRDTEAELQKQVTTLEGQQKELERVATLRKQHERAGELASRDDDAPHRGVQKPTGGGRFGGKETTDDNAAPQAGSADGTGSQPPADPAGGVTGPSAEETTVVLGDVVDGSTLDKLQKAQRSGDPAQRAAAAKAARDAVAARLAKLKAQRAAIEARAKSLRSR